MTKLKYLFYGSLALIAGCAPLDWLIGAPGESSGALDAVTDVALNSGNPPLVVAGLAILTLAAIARGIYHKNTVKEIVSSVGDGLKELDGEQLASVKKVISTSMPAFAKKAVTKIKANL